MNLRWTKLVPLSLLVSFEAVAVDWPMWRDDPGRTGATKEALPKQLHLQWTLKLPPLVAAYKDPRLQFDKGYEPIVTRGKMIVGSSWTDSVTAYDAANGKIDMEVQYTTSKPVPGLSGL